MNFQTLGTLIALMGHVPTQGDVYYKAAAMQDPTGLAYYDYLGGVLEGVGACGPDGSDYRTKVASKELGSHLVLEVLNLL